MLITCKVSQLVGLALVYVVKKAAMQDDELRSSLLLFTVDRLSPLSWAHGGMILTAAKISRTIDHSGLWIAYWTDGYTEGDEGQKCMQCDKNELVAGLRCYVALRLGDTVAIPEELLCTNS